MSSRLDVEILPGVPDLLGEGPAYDAENGRLCWVDIIGGRVRELRWESDWGWQPGRTWEMGDETSAVLPKRRGGLLVLVRTAVLALSDDGKRETLASLDGLIDNLDHSVVRFNDAKCDPYGRLIAGWVVLDGSHPGGLVRIDADGSVDTLLSDVAMANGMGWSPDGEIFYFIDSSNLRVDAFDYDLTTGTLAERRPLVTVERGTGVPDGMSVDHEGCLWVALPFAGEVRRYSADGALLEIIETPTQTPLSCAFGGPDGRDLFITSGSSTVTSEQPKRRGEHPLGVTSEQIDATRGDCLGGRLFVCRPGPSGPPATPFMA